MQTKHYAGEVLLEFDQGKHSYTADGVTVPSVTQITGVLSKDALLQWGANQSAYFLRDRLRGASEEELLGMIGDDGLFNEARFAHRRKKEEAADIGTQAHQWIERVLRWEQDRTKKPEAPEVRRCCEAALAFLDASKLRHVSTEQRIYSRRYGYAGTLDKIALLAGRHVVLDWKTGSGIWPEHRLQTAAYAAAWEEEHGADIPVRIIVRLGKQDGKFHVQQLAGWREDFKVFRACKQILDWRAKHKTKNAKKGKK